jgi:hypothetical protein
MAEWIKRFIVWYLCKRCNAVFEYNGKVVRVFSKEFYDTEVREHQAKRKWIGITPRIELRW